MTHSWIAPVAAWAYPGTMFVLRKIDGRRTPLQQVWRRESWRKAHSKRIQAGEVVVFGSAWVLLLFTDHWVLGLLCLVPAFVLLGVTELRRRRLVGDGRLISR